MVQILDSKRVIKNDWYLASLAASWLGLIFHSKTDLLSSLHWSTPFHPWRWGTIRDRRPLSQSDCSPFRGSASPRMYSQPHKPKTKVQMYSCSKRAEKMPIYLFGHLSTVWRSLHVALLLRGHLAIWHIIFHLKDRGIERMLLPDGIEG